MRDLFGPVRPSRRRSERSRRAWYDFKPHGHCEVCGRYGRRTAHHVVLEQLVRRVAPDRVWDTANRLLVGWSCCHAKHHGGGDGRIEFTKLPDRCAAFACEVLGVGPAANYFARHYRAPDPPQPEEEAHAAEKQPFGRGPSA